MTAVLGISAFYHDSAAALVVDGRIVAAAQEERFSRRKNDDAFPARAIEYCLAAGGLTAADLDYVGFYEKPLQRFERLLETYLAYAPTGFSSFRVALPQWLQRKLFLSRTIRKGLGGGFRKRVIFAEHHQSHAASAFFPSPFEEAAVVTFDAVGEWATTSWGVGRGHRVDMREEVRFPHSLGMLYSAFTWYTGFSVNSGEYKMMGLAPFGVPRFADLIMQRMLRLRDDGSFELDMSYFNYCQGLTMTSSRFHRLFGREPRRPDQPITQLDMDLAASAQKVTEEVMLRIVRHVHERTGMKSLCLAGGVALNCVANGRILREGPFEKLWIQPAAGDAGGALGVALHIWHQLLDNPRTPEPRDSQRGSFLGIEYSDAEIAALLERHGVPHRQAADDEELARIVAADLAQGLVVGWFEGRMEFGPRALGARSILADARNPRMQSIVNRKVKFREGFRPFAPLVLEEHAHEYFEVEPGFESPYMLIVAPVRAERRLPVDDARAGLDRVHDLRSDVPAITHVDYSARIQTVDRDRHGALRALLEQFHALTGCPVLVNTSFNLSWEPIVCSPAEALRTFFSSELDVLCLGHRIIRKSDQPISEQVAPAPIAETNPGSGAAGGLREFIDAARRDTFLEWLDRSVPFNRTVITCGPAAGEIANYLAVGFRRVIGVATDHDAARRAEQQSAAFQLGRVRHVAGFEETQLGKGSVDVVYATGALQDVQPLRELSDLLAPGGHLILRLRAGLSDVLSLARAAQLDVVRATPAFQWSEVAASGVSMLDAAPLPTFADRAVGALAGLGGARESLFVLRTAVQPTVVQAARPGRAKAAV